MINYKLALNYILKSEVKLNKERVLTGNSLNRISFYNVYSKINSPPFKSAAMDGYAIKSSITKNASHEKKIKALLVGEQFAGGNLEFYEINPINKSIKNHCIKITTGSKVPNDFDSVIKLEDVDKVYDKESLSEFIIISNKVSKSTNIKLCGEDFKKNDKVLSKNDIINESHIMAMYSVGIKSIDVMSLPRISIICTGTEILDINDNYNNDQSDTKKIYNSNVIYLCKFFKSIGLKYNYHGITNDNYNEILNKIIYIRERYNPNIIISIGGVSVGCKDSIPNIVEELKSNIIFHKVYIKPGKPILFSKMQDNIYFFGLPGNPIASIIGLRFFIYTFIRKIFMINKELPILAKLESTIVINRPEFTNFKKAKLKIMPNSNALVVNIIDEQESFKVRPMIYANCWAIFDKEKKIYEKDEMINIYCMIPYSWKNTMQLNN